MKKLLFVLLCLVSAATARAEDIIQAVPFQAEPGLTTDDAFCFSVRMNNTEPIWAYQLDFLLPEGMTLDDTDGLNPFELNPDRFPHSSRGGVITYKHGIAWKQQPDGWYRVIVSPNDATRIEGTEGEVMKVYILTSPDMKPGLYPIKVRGEILDLFLEFIQDEDHSILLSSHITSDLEKVADSVAYIHKGRLLFQKDKDELLESYALIQCSAQDLARLPAELIVHSREHAFGRETLVRDPEQVQRLLPGAVFGKADIDTIMQYYTGRDAQ